jgi:anti-anti-sigma factor
MPEETQPATPEFRLMTAREAERFHLSASGELDLTSVPELEAALLGAGGCRELVVDLAGVTFMDSTGLRLLLAERERARLDGVDFAVTGAAGPVARILAISGFDADLTPRETPLPPTPGATGAAEAPPRPLSPFGGVYPAEPASVSELRHAISDYALQAGADEEVVSAVGLAVSGAATNAIVHAYVDASTPGTLAVEAGIEGEELWVSVSDSGRGMRPRPDSPGLGLGLPLIAQMTTGFEVHERDAGGTEVQMRFAL